jgi:hypothetical protein
MASPKKRRKQAKLTRQRQQPRTGPFRHADGDRRRKGGPRIEDILADKVARHQFEAMMLAPHDEEE